MDRPSDEEVLHWIDLTNMCQTFHCLPSPGGLYDQDPYVLARMKTVLVAQNERHELDMKKASQKS